MKRCMSLGILLGLLASPALGLSCLRPDVVRTYIEAAESEARYVVVHGTLRFDEARLPEAVTNDSPPSTKIPAQLTGKALSHGRFDQPFDRDITLDVLCFGSWCGGAASGIEYLGFLEASGGHYTLTLNPCGGQGFAEPTPDMLLQVEQCNSGGPCKPHSP